MPKNNPYKNIADDDDSKIRNERLRVSFKYIDIDDEAFFFDGHDKKYYKKFFECLTTLKSCRAQEITQQSHPSLAPKSIFNTKLGTRQGFPDSIRSKVGEMLLQAFEISLGKNHGRIHGFILDNIFYIVWVDPAHNLYPGTRSVLGRGNFQNGGKRVFSYNTLVNYQNEIDTRDFEITRLTTECNDLMKLLESKTA